MLEENKDIIHLQNSHVTQYTNTAGKSEWKVRKNITSEDLAELPGELTEEQIFAIMDFAKKFELLAFNEGINLGKDISRKNFEPQFEYQNHALRQLSDENERLANKLMQLISREE